MTKMVAMPIYDKTPSKIYFSGTGLPISKKVGVKHRWLKNYNVCINHDTVMTVAYFRARSTWVACAFEWVKLLKSHLKKKTCRKFANGQDNDYSVNKMAPVVIYPFYWGYFL